MNLSKKNNEALFIEKLLKVAMILSLITLIGFISIDVTAYAAADPVTAINNLKDYIASFFEAIGVIAVLIGIFLTAIGWFSHDATQKITGVAAIGGGVFLAGASFVADKILN